ncbi:hypothetical protein NKH18_30335 [Streptomyces sp. M10(2022)]
MTSVTALPPTTEHLPTPRALPPRRAERRNRPTYRPGLRGRRVVQYRGTGLADDARLCVSEVVTNAHCHTRSRLIRVEVAVRGAG